MYSLAMGIPGPGPNGRLGLDREEWWEGVVAVATFEGGMLQSLQVHPVDLGLDLPTERRGIPRVPAPSRAARMLEKIRRLSERYDITMRIENGMGIVDVR
jgi:poly-gamma-glutamate synthesis protein (capsule biosynthesis protein)